MNRDWKPGEFKVHTAYKISSDGYDIFAAWKDWQNNIHSLAPAQFVQAQQTSPWIAAGTDISYRQLLQGFLEAAWELGLRPAEWSDTKLQLVATRAHLADMRAIVAGKLKVELP